MAKGLLGKKIGMTQIFDEDENMVPVTVIEAGPCVVTEKRTEEKDGYQAVQLGFEDIKEKKLNKPELGQFEKNGVDPKRYLMEFRNFDQDLEIGDEVTVDIFEKGEIVKVQGISKGKGFSGNIQRWNQSAGPKTHGSHFHRAPGSIGAVDASRVFKGQKMPGRMGNEKTTVHNLKVMRVDSEKKVILVKGSVPGPKKSLVSLIGKEK
ncbi:MAG TPA: 50S ribosomal protein L3 [Halanaerobiales bacterium]|nr:50S ribosomal protein L3 [Halanaerobiales bacterium]